MTALTLIKILRPLWRSVEGQAHLTECASYEVIDRAFNPALPRLLKRHVLGLVDLPDTRRTKPPAEVVDFVSAAANAARTLSRPGERAVFIAHGAPFEIALIASKSTEEGSQPWNAPV